MNYTFSIQENRLSIAHNGRPLLEGIYLSVLTQRRGSCDVYPEEVKLTENGAEIAFAACDRLSSVALRFLEVDSVLQCSISASTVLAKLGSQISYLFASNDSIKLHFSFARPVSGNYITDCSTKLWFQSPSFSRDLSALPLQTQDIHIQSEDEHIHLLPLVSDDLRTEFKGDALVASIGCAGVSSVEGQILTVSVGNDPYGVIKASSKLRPFSI